MAHGTQYVRLRNLSDDQASTDNQTRVTTQHLSAHSRRLRPSRYCRTTTLTILVLISVLLNLVLLAKAIFFNVSNDQPLTYSPAQPALRYERVVFSSGFGIETSLFQGKPSAKNNKLWESLYDFGITRVSVDEARPMDNKTLPIPGPEGGYVIQLSVFHQLHCLNLIRKGIYGEVDMTNKDELLGIEHLDHCLDMLRQAVMCSSDITPTTFSRTSLGSKMKVVAEVVHTCRSFADIQQWAWNRRLRSGLDKDTVVTDDPLKWGTYTYTP